MIKTIPRLETEADISSGVLAPMVALHSRMVIHHVPASLNEIPCFLQCVTQFYTGFVCHDLDVSQRGKSENDTSLLPVGKTSSYTGPDVFFFPD